ALGEVHRLPAAAGGQGCARRRRGGPSRQGRAGRTRGQGVCKGAHAPAAQRWRRVLIWRLLHKRDPRQSLEDAMTTGSEGQELTRVGPGTIMGDLMRCYWIPAALSSELVRDGAPVRLMLLGEKLIAFRDSAGRVGVMDHRCPHRCASLFLGRNEDRGLRCIYHGWKFDVAGNCVDMPSIPTDQDFRSKVKAKAYPAVERAGLVWVYMGARAEAPPLPALDILDAPASEIKVHLVQRDCN